MPIRRLSQSLVNKIAAGEVIERPASVAKELLENAVDAGATRIDVTANGGGAEVIRVVDNGCGIAPDELPLAVASHATSKLAEADDLFRVATLGFRGEALASIAEVSRLVLRSRTAESAAGAELEVVGGRSGEPAPCGCPVGTSVEVRNLFFNTPVRRKFLRTPQTEFGHISEAFLRIALAAPEIHFTLRHNDREVFDLPCTDGWLDRIGRCFGRALADALIWVESGEGPVRVAGYVANPTHSRSNNRMQYLFLNGRHIRDRSLQHALGEAYRGLLTVGRYPVAFLRLDVPPEEVDVNVHPTKLEVRFQDSGRLYSQLLSTLRGKFLTTDLTVHVHSDSGDTPGDHFGDDPSDGHDATHAACLRQELVDWAKGEVATWSGRDSSDGRSVAGSGYGPSPSAEGRRPLELTRLDRPWGPPGDGACGHAGSVSDSAGESSAASSIASSGETASTPPRGPTGQALQIHNRYLVAETDDGVTIIDQHALHERILYEQLRERVMAGAVETQNLLVPEPVDLSPAEAAAALENRGLLAQLGVAIEPFGGETILLTGYPAILANLRPADLLHGLLEQLLAGGRLPDRRDLLDDLLHTVACKAAIKAGDHLTADEITSLLQQRHLVADPHHCPHGRPAALVFTREELDKQFKRT